MTISNQFLMQVVEALSRVGDISYRRIFNGYGIYHQGIQFAIVIHDCLYFRACDASRGLYVAKHMSAFAPAALGVSQSHFFQLPADVLNQPDELRYWMRIAVEAADALYAPEEDATSLTIPVKHLKVR